MDPLAAIAERRIQEAIERGEFDDLPGKGKPLRLEDDDGTVPAELWLAYRMLKNAGQRLRAKLGSAGALIETVRGFGYPFRPADRTPKSR